MRLSTTLCLVLLTSHPHRLALAGARLAHVLNEAFH